MEKIWNKKFILLFITNLLMMATFYASVPILPIYCQQNGITGSQIGIVLTAMSVTTVSVSYTHLDVYKRQIFRDSHYLRHRK